MSAQTLFAAMKARTGGTATKMVLTVLADISNEEDQCYPSMEYIAAVTEMSRRSVMRHITALEESGFIVRERRFTAEGDPDSNMYTIDTDKCHECAIDWKAERKKVKRRDGGGSDKLSPPSDKLTRGVVTNCHGGSDKLAPYTPNYTPNNIHKGAEEILLEQADPSVINIGAWFDWVKYRKEIKKKMTPTTVQRQLKLLERHSKDVQRDIVEQSITNGWTGLFEPKGKSPGPDANSTRATDIRDELTDTSWAH